MNNLLSNTPALEIGGPGSISTNHVVWRSYDQSGGFFWQMFDDHSLSSGNHRLEIQGSTTGSTPFIEWNLSGEMSLFGSQNAEALLFTALTGTKKMKAQIPLYFEQIAAAGADTLTEGQFWVRNTLDGEPMFTDDQGVDSVLNASGAVSELVDGGSNVALIANGSGRVALRSVGNTDAELRILDFNHQDGTNRGLIGYEAGDSLVIRNSINNMNIIFNCGIFGGSRLRLHLDGTSATGGASLYAGTSSVPRLQSLTHGVEVGNGTLFLVEQAAQEADIAVRVSSGLIQQMTVSSTLRKRELCLTCQLVSSIPPLTKSSLGSWEFTNVLGLELGPSCELDMRNNADNSTTFIQNLGPTLQFGIAGGDFGSGIFEISQSSWAKVVCPPLFIGEQAAAEVGRWG